MGMDVCAANFGQLPNQAAAAVAAAVNLGNRWFISRWIMTAK